jgi:hypothetical protein
MRRSAPPRACRLSRVGALVGLAVIGSTGLGATGAQASGTGSVVVASVTDLGPLQHPQGPLGDGGASTDLNGQEVWVFGDTLLPHKNNDKQHFITNSGGWSSPALPYVINQQLEQPSGDPVQMIPFTSGELAYNQSTHNDPTNRYALWPDSIVSGADGNGYIFFEDVLVRGSWKFVPQGMGLAKLTPGSLVAERIGTVLFPANVAGFGRSAMVAGDGYLYLYGCLKKQKTGCQVARSPLTQLSDASAYRVWDGQQWNIDLTRGVPVVPGSGSAVSVQWNAHLKAYVDTYNYPRRNKMLAATAPTPQGPWSPSIELFKGLPVTVVGSWDYGLRQHPSLSSTDGMQVIVTYDHPTNALAVDIRVVQVNLQ